MLKVEEGLVRRPVLGKTKTVKSELKTLIFPHFTTRRGSNSTEIRNRVDLLFSLRLSSADRFVRE